MNEDSKASRVILVFLENLDFKDSKDHRVKPEILDHLAQ